MQNAEITEAWQKTFCRQMFKAENAEKMLNMIRGAIDGYIAHHGVYTSAVKLHDLWQGGINFCYFCYDKEFQTLSNNEENRVAVMEYLIQTFPLRS